MDQSIERLLPLATYYPYGAIFLLLVVGIWFFPFAEEIALAAAGYLCFLGEVGLVPILLVTCAGVFLGDFLAFRLGQGWGPQRLRHSLACLVGKRRMTIIDSYFERYGARALFFTRFIPGTRLPAHLLAGAHGMPTTTYARINLLSVLAYVPVVFGLAYQFGEEIDEAMHYLKNLGDAALVAFLSLLLLWCLVRLF